MKRGRRHGLEKLFENPRQQPLLRGPHGKESREEERLEDGAPAIPAQAGGDTWREEAAERQEGSEPARE